MIPDFSKDDAMNSLSLLAEVFFRRLWNKADDFGRYDARPLILKAELFPLRETRLPDISRCLQECEAAGLLVSYKAEGGTFLQISNFNQRVRAAKSKYPPMPDGCRSNVGQVSGGCRRKEEDESEISPSPRVREDGFTFEEVLAAAKDPSVALSEADCRAFFEHYDGEWTYGNGQAITNLATALRRWKAKKGAFDGRAKAQSAIADDYSLERAFEYIEGRNLGDYEGDPRGSEALKKWAEDNGVYERLRNRNDKLYKYVFKTK